MTLNEYQADAVATANSKHPDDLRVVNWAMGLAGEAGECLDLVKKWFFHGHPEVGSKLREELGDVLWYVAVMADELNVNLSEIARANTAKLRERYPEGFTPKASQERVQ